MAIFNKSKNQDDELHPMYGEAKQLELEVKKNRKESWYKFKKKLIDYENTFENLPYWRSWTNVFSLITIVATIAIAYFALSRVWDNLPANIPLFYSNEIQNWELYPKEFLIYTTVGIVVLEIIVFFAAFKMFKFDKRLSTVLNIVIVISSILYGIAILQLSALVLI